MKTKKERRKIILLWSLAELCVWQQFCFLPGRIWRMQMVISTVNFLPHKCGTVGPLPPKRWSCFTTTLNIEWIILELYLWFSSCAHWNIDLLIFPSDWKMTSIWFLIGYVKWLIRPPYGIGRLQETILEHMELDTLLRGVAWPTGSDFEILLLLLLRRRFPQLRPSTNICIHINWWQS